MLIKKIRIFLRGLGAMPALLFLAAIVLTPPAAAQSTGGGVSLGYMPGSSHKLYQINGDCDWVQWDATIGNATPTCNPTVSQTATKADVLGDDVPVAFEHNGELIVTFGDTIGAAGYSAWTNVQNSFLWGAHDPIARSTTTSAADGLLLNFFLNGTHGLEVLPPPQPDGTAVDMGVDNVPHAGVSLNGTIYLGIKTGNVSSGDGNNDQSHDYSVLASFDETTETFTSGRTISTLPNGHFVGPTFYLAPAGVLGTPPPVSPEPAMLIFGVGAFRASNVYLSIIPSTEFASGVDQNGSSATRYFSGMSNGQPTWSSGESSAVPIVTDLDPANPTISNASVFYSQPLGLWLMVYDGGRGSLSTEGLYFTYSPQPWGPWSTPQLVFNGCRDKGFGNFIFYYYATAAENGCPSAMPAGVTSAPNSAGPAGPTIGNQTVNDPNTTRGDAYAPTFVERFAIISGSTLKLFYMFATWNPYAVVMMESDFNITQTTLGTPTSPVPTSSPTPSDTTPTASATPTKTLAPTPTFTLTATIPATVTQTPTATRTHTAAGTGAATQTPTSTVRTPTPTPSATAHSSATPTPPPSPTPSTSATPTGACTGDCNGDGQVTVDEILTMVNIALGNTPVTACEAGDANHDGQITVDEILAAVNYALNGCPTAPPVVQLPSGIYVLNETSNEQSTTTAYASGLTSSPAYQSDVTGHAIFVPIEKILPSITTLGQFDWNWGYLDTLVQIAVSNGEKFSVELETGFQTSSTYLQSLPSGFAATCGADCAPLFDVWATGGSGGTCISAYVLLPWVLKVQEFWSAAAAALAAHLQETGVYGALTLIHVPGLSVYDEEIRLPTGYPSPSPTDTQACPDGRPAYPTVINDASTSRWQGYGYSDTAVINGFKVIATAFAQAFPDRALGLSLFNPGANGIDFPNLTDDPVGYVASQIVQEVTAIAPGRVQLQSDNLDSNFAQSEVTALASQYSDAVGWQTNKHAETGAGCNGGGAGSCDPDGPNSPYFHLLQNGAQNAGAYLEVWSTDVVNYPQSFAAAKSAGFFPAR